MRYMAETIPTLGKSDQNLVWIDCEMTGLDPEVDRLIEIAVVVTGPHLSPPERAANAADSASLLLWSLQPAAATGGVTWATPHPPA